MGDGGHRGGLQLEGDVGFRLRVGRVLRNRRGVVGEAGLAHELDGVGGGAPPAEQVAHGQALLQRLDHADALRLHQITGGADAAGDHCLHRHGKAVAATTGGLGGKRGEPLVLGEDFTHGFRTAIAAFAAVQLDDQLLSRLQARLQLALGDQQLVDAGLGFFGHLGVSLQVLLGLLGVLAQVITYLLQVGLDLLVLALDVAILAGATELGVGQAARRLGRLDAQGDKAHDGGTGEQGAGGHRSGHRHDGRDSQRDGDSQGDHRQDQRCSEFQLFHG
ncbi:hypothetical protein D9M68_653460 [compost metagenome]